MADGMSRVLAFYDVDLATGETIQRAYHLEDVDADLVERVVARLGDSLGESMTPDINAEKIDIVVLRDSDG